jgi:hypothetical protein
VEQIFDYWLRLILTISGLDLSATIHRISPLNYTPVIAQAEISNNKEFQKIKQFAIANNLHQRPMSEIVQAIADQLLGSSYKAGLLDKSSREKLVISLEEFDCVLFVETVLALSRSIAVQDYSFQTFSDRVSELRYRNGSMDGYCSRLHYFSEWILDNQRRGSVQSVAQYMGGRPLNKNLNFMSSHWQSYPQITSSEANYWCIAAMEKNIGKIDIEYIPINRIDKAYSKLQSGDVIAIATAVSGLDTTHTGLVYRLQNGNIGLIHASPSGSVRISSDLQYFAANVEDAIGIMVVRPIDPRK